MRVTTTLLLTAVLFIPNAARAQFGGTGSPYGPYGPQPVVGGIPGLPSPSGAGGQRWQGEDLAFCWLVRQVGGRIVGLLSPTIGHELSEGKYIRI